MPWFHLAHYVILYTNCMIFLLAEVEPFTSKFMSSSILKRLLTQQNIVQNISHEEHNRKNLTLYSVGAAATFFCLVLEGRVEVEIGNDKLKFESRAFSYFGARALIFARESLGADYRADFTARPLTDCLLVIITQGQYMAARRASVFEEAKTDSCTLPIAGVSSARKSDIFSTEWAKAETIDLSTSRTRGSLFQLPGFLSKQSKSPDQLRLLEREESDSGSSGRASPVEVRVELGDMRDRNASPQARTTGNDDNAYQSSQV